MSEVTKKSENSLSQIRLLGRTPHYTFIKHFVDTFSVAKSWQPHSVRQAHPGHAQLDL